MVLWFARRRRPRPRGEPDGIAVAFLAGGPLATVWASLASLHNVGAVAVGSDGHLVFPGPSPDRDTVPFAVLTALRAGVVRPAALVTTTEVAAAVGRLRHQLATDGWLGNRSATRELLNRLRNTHRHLKPQLDPALRVYGPNGAALAVAIFGPNAVWRADPRFAGALGMPFPRVARQRPNPALEVDPGADCACS